MSVTKYSFVKSVNRKRLKKEISDSSIVIALDYIKNIDSALDIYFKDILSSSDETTLNTIISNHINLPLDESNPVTSNNIPKVAVYDGEGEGESIPSHDWSDKTTWFQNSERFTGVPVTVTDKIGKIGHYNIIDTKNGKITFEDELHPTYGLVVYHDGVEIDYDDDYYVDYNHGKIYFRKTPTGSITVDFSKATDSVFTVKIPDGKENLKIKDAEVNFTSDIIMKPIVFQIGYVHPINGWTPVFSKTYKNIKDLINIARAGKGSIPRVFPLRHDVLIFPIKYLKSIKLEYVSGIPLELKVFIEDHNNLEGEYATITFYTEVDE